jgi:hypothetical protein
MVFNRCEGYLEASMPEFLAFGRACQERQLGLRCGAPRRAPAHVMQNKHSMHAAAGLHPSPRIVLRNKLDLLPVIEASCPRAQPLEHVALVLRRGTYLWISSIRRFTHIHAVYTTHKNNPHTPRCSPSSGTLEPVGTAAWPPCDTDSFTTAVCTELLGSGANSCEADFCAEGDCPLKHHSGRNR